MCGILKTASVYLRRSHIFTARVKGKILKHNMLDTSWIHSFLCLLYIASEKGVGSSIAF